MTGRELLELAAKAARMVCYSPNSGEFIWKSKPQNEPDSQRWNTRYAGKFCGTYDDKGYLRILVQIDGKKRKIRAHRLAWFIVHGVLPSGEIDHINQDKADNRISNLRDVPKELNQRNGTRKRNNTSGVPGVTWHKQRGKWCAQASLGGKHYHIGLYDNIMEAEAATRKFRAEHGFTENHGRIV